MATRKPYYNRLKSFVRTVAGAKTTLPAEGPICYPATSGRVFGQTLEDVQNAYMFEHELSRSLSGVTYLVTHKTTRQQFACKSIPACNFINKEDADDLRREVQVMCCLADRHNVMQLKAVYEDLQSVNLIIELCDGGDLWNHIGAKGHYSERTAAGLLGQIMMILHDCHTAGILHRDLRPENLLFLSTEESSLLKLTGFGLSVFVKPGYVFKDTDGRAYYTAHKDGGLSKDEAGRAYYMAHGGDEFEEEIGLAYYMDDAVKDEARRRAYYMAPEVVRQQEYGAEADIWSAGVILYMLLSGFRPFEGEEDMDIFESVLKGNLDFASYPWPKISASAKDLVKKMLRADPKERISAIQVLNDPWLIEEDGHA